MSGRDLFDLSGKCALISGGSRGLGLQIAEGLGEKGARVALVARDASALAKAADGLRSKGIDVLTVTADLKTPGAIPDIVTTVIEGFGSIDLLVNNAGIAHYHPAETFPLEAWRDVMMVNLDAVFMLTQEVARRTMIPNATGKILNIASVGGLRGNPVDMDMKILPYNVSKAAVINMTQTLAVEWGGYNININALCPGWFPTDMSGEFLAAQNSKIIRDIPLRRLGGNSDLKGPALLLLSEAGRHITGQYIVVDGGQTAAL